MSKPDPVLDEIRRVRREMSAEINHDPKRLLEFYQQLEEKYRHRIVGEPQHVAVDSRARPEEPPTDSN